MREPPYPTEVKPYGRALVDLARRRDEVLCLSGDLTRQCGLSTQALIETIWSGSAAPGPPRPPRPRPPIAAGTRPSDQPLPSHPVEEHA